ncbi:MAG: hypothetical protein QXH07_04645 [Thermoplasmata archaeon]
MVSMKHRGTHFYRGAKHLYTKQEKEAFRKRYGKRGDAIFGATIHKVKLEQERKREQERKHK